MSSGTYGNSHLDLLNINSMVNEKSVGIDSQYFGEGITRLNNGDIYMLTYRSRTALHFNAEFELIKTFTIPSRIKEGWGMTHVGDMLLISDGSNSLYWVDPVTFTITDSFKVPNTKYINELEFVNDLIYANRFLRSDILVFTVDGTLVKELDFRALLDNESSYNSQNGVTWSGFDKTNNVLNGIAYHA